MSIMDDIINEDGNNEIKEQVEWIGNLPLRSISVALVTKKQLRQE